MFMDNSYLKNRAKHGNGYAPCIVSDRFLKISQSYDEINAGKVINVDVMTKGKDNQDRKLCSLFVTLEDIERALLNCKDRKSD